MSGYNSEFNSSVGIATGYGLNGKVRVPVGTRFYLLHVVQTGIGAHPASYPMDTGDKAIGV
jgi:hypothetical protein